MNQQVTDNQRSQHVTTGAGVAIAGIWIGASGLTAILALIAFVWDDPKPVPETEMSGGEAWLLLFLIALPMLAAFTATMRILGRD